MSPRRPVPIGPALAGVLHDLHLGRLGRGPAAVGAYLTRAALAALALGLPARVIPPVGEPEGTRAELLDAVAAQQRAAAELLDDLTGIRPQTWH